MATAELTVSANLQGLRQQLESIPGMTAEQARLMTAELNKSIRASEKAAKQAADASKRAMEQAAAGASRAAGAVDNLGDRFGKVGSNSAKLAGALGMVNPGLADMARNVADLADVGEVGASLSGLGLAIGSITAVAGLFVAGLAPIAELFVEQRQRAEEAAAALDKWATSSAEAGDAAEGLAGSIRSVGDEIKLKEGIETADEQAIRRKSESMRQQVTELEAKYQAEIDDAQAVLDSTKAEYDSLSLKVLYGKATEEQAARFKELGVAVNGATETIKNNTATIQQARPVVEAQIKKLEEIAERERKAEAQRKAAERAAKAKAEADRKAAEAARVVAEAERQLQSVRASAQSVIDTEVSAAGRILAKQEELRNELEAHPELYGEVTAAIAVLDRQLQALDDKEVDEYLKRQADAAKELQSAYEQLIPPEVPTRQEQFATLTAQVEQAFRDGIITFDEYQAKLAEIQEAQEDTFSLDQFAAFFEGIKASTSQVFSDLESLSSFFLAQNESALAEAIKARKELGEDATKDEKDEAKKRVQAAREAAMRQFEITKALQIAQVVVNTAAAAAQALASSPPPFNFVAAAAAAAAGAVQLATVASTQPKFHKGGLIGQPDESMAVVRAGEAVLNPMGRKALGDEAIRAANAGALDHGGGAVQVVYKHKSFDYFVRDHLRTNATLPRALNAGRRLGHRGG